MSTICPDCEECRECDCTCATEDVDPATKARHERELRDRRLVQANRDLEHASRRMSVQAKRIDKFGSDGLTITELVKLLLNAELTLDRASRATQDAIQANRAIEDSGDWVERWARTHGARN